jgi:VWFA-related protein
MNSLSKLSFIFFWTVILFFTFTDVTHSQQTDDVVTVDTTLVRLNVGVVDRTGRPITNLNRQNFAVYEDDVKQQILSFEPTATPFSLILLLDISGSTRSFRQLMSQAAARFVDVLKPDDRVAVVAFNKKPEILKDFTTNRQDIYYAINLINSQSKSGETMLYKALGFSLNRLGKEGQRRKAIIVLTDGVDTELEADDRRNFSNTNSANNSVTSTIKADQNPKLNLILDSAAKQGVTVYPLALPSGDPKKIPDPSPFQVAKYTAARERLEFLANRTGGSLNAINRLEDMSRLYVAVAAELQTLYSVEYEPAANRNRDGKWRTIKIEVDQPELFAKTRPGYFAK